VVLVVNGKANDHAIEDYLPPVAPVEAHRPKSGAWMGLGVRLAGRP